MPKVSIVVPVYNVEKYLRRCLDSVVNQTFADFECLVVNDGTKDNSQVIIDEYVNKDKRIISYIKENGGLSSARNYGIERAKGEYIYFFDSDDFIENDLLEKCVSKMAENDSDMVVFDYFQYRLSNNTDEVISLGLDEKKVYSLNENKEMMTQIKNCAWNKMYKLSLFKDNDIRYPEGFYYEDLGTTYRLLLNCRQIVYLNEPLYHYILDRPGNITTQFNKNVYDVIDMAQLNIDYYQKQKAFEKYYEELKYLSCLNVIECLRKTPFVIQTSTVKDYIERCFKFMKTNWPEFPKCKYNLNNQQKQFIYLYKPLLKLYILLKAPK